MDGQPEAAAYALTNRDEIFTPELSGSPAGITTPVQQLPLMPQHAVPPRLELVAGLPGGPGVGVRHANPGREQHPEIVHRPAQVPVGLHLVADVVVVVIGVLVPLGLAVAVWLPDVVDPAVEEERGHPLLGELEMVGPVVEPLLRFGIG